jgi:hypothetical protein
MEWWSAGVLECWSDGVMERWSGGVRDFSAGDFQKVPPPGSFHQKAPEDSAQVGDLRPEGV